MASNRVVNIRICKQKIYVCEYTYDNKKEVFDILNYFPLKYALDLHNLNDIEQCAELLNTEFLSHNIKSKQIVFTIMSLDTQVLYLDSIKQKNYLKNVQVLHSLAAEKDSIMDIETTSLAYINTSEYSIEVENDKGKKKTVQHMNSISYIVKQDILKTLNELAEHLNKEILRIDYAPSGIYNYFNRFIRQQYDSCILLHISDEYSVITVFKRGITVNQYIDTFNYHNIQIMLNMFKNSLRSPLDSIDSAIDCINKMYLYTITKQDLARIRGFNDIERDQIIEAQSQLIDYTMDLIDRIKAIMNNEIRDNSNYINMIYIFNDQLTFPDLSYTISSILNIKAMNIGMHAEVVSGVEKTKDRNYLQSTISTELNSVNLDVNFVKKKKSSDIFRATFYSILGVTFISVLSIIFFYVGSYMKENNRNTVLNQEILEAEEAERVYNEHMQISAAYDTLDSFVNKENDLKDFNEQLNAIDKATSKGLTISSIQATSGEGSSQGTLSLTVTAKNKELFAEFLDKLNDTGLFSDIEQNSVSDSGGKGNSRTVSGSVVCRYPAHEEAPTPEETPEGGETTDESTSTESSDVPEEIVMPN